MPLQATSGAASYDAFGGGAAAVPNYIEDVFSTYLYTGNATARSIVNDIDLSTKGGLVWFKNRSADNYHLLFDTARGVGKEIYTNTTDAEGGPYSPNQTLQSFNSNGFTIGTNSSMNGNGSNIVSWTFREQPKFFDVLTYTGDGAVSRNIAHNLGSEVGSIFLKRTSGASSSWSVYHRSLGTGKFLQLNTTGAVLTDADTFASVTSTTFSVSSNTNQNDNGATYVAYLFAHNAGGFGLTGTDNVISCGSYTGSNSSAVSVNLGYEPQWVMIKRTDSSGSPAWWIGDTMRGLNMQGINRLEAWTSNAESAAYNGINPTATGFVLPYGTVLNDAATSNYIYIAIRRGPMKVPTSGTSVFDAEVISESTTPPLYPNTINAGFVVDAAFEKFLPSTGNNRIAARLMGSFQMNTNSTSAEFANPNDWASNTTATMAAANGSAGNTVMYAFQRAPSYMDVVFYTGTGTAGQTYTHNLGVAPELMIVKNRTTASQWLIYQNSLGNTQYLLFLTDATATGSFAWNNTSPTSSVFSVGTSGACNTAGENYVAYLFATCAGVSKVTAFTGNGSTQTINCGFTSGARFVMIKATSTTGNWLVFDTARGMTTSTDPWLALNSTAAESATTGACTTTSVGFTVDESKLTGVNTNGVSYIALAVA